MLTKRTHSTRANAPRLASTPPAPRYKTKQHTHTQEVLVCACTAPSCDGAPTKSTRDETRPPMRCMSVQYTYLSVLYSNECLLTKFIHNVRNIDRFKLRHNVCMTQKQSTTPMPNCSRVNYKNKLRIFPLPIWRYVTAKVYTIY